MAEERVKRKLAAILAADVVGYSRLMGADEAGTLSALKRHREAIFDPAVACSIANTRDCLVPEARLLVLAVRPLSLSFAPGPGSSVATTVGLVALGLFPAGKGLAAETRL
jgi:hypothetical protein